MIKAIVFDYFGVLDDGTDGLNQELVTIIKTLRPARRIGLLTNSERANVDKFLHKHNVRSLFDVILASSQTRFVKPQFELFEIITERLDLPPEQILFVDDSSVNTAAARNFGMQAVTYRSIDDLKLVL
jgi:putative hydrolase of the HAD superfamily